MGIIFIVIAIGCWGVGDFLIQRSTRKLGDWEPLFLITAFGTIILTPFIIKDLIQVWNSGLDGSTAILFLVMGFVTLFAGLLDFEALKRGKISIVEPIYTLELLVTALLASLVIGETLSLIELGLIVLLLSGIFLISVSSFHDLKHIRLERGVLLAIFATIGMGGVNFLFGLNSRETNPLLVNWFVNIFIAIISGIYLIKYPHKHALKEVIQNRKLIFWVCLLDNVAWIAYAYSTTYTQIAIATGLTESYIVIACLLGIYLNKERLLKHQYIGLFVTIFAGISLAIISEI